MIREKSVPRPWVPKTPGAPLPIDQVSSQVEAEMSNGSKGIVLPLCWCHVNGSRDKPEMLHPDLCSTLLKGRRFAATTGTTRRRNSEALDNEITRLGAFAL
jgi:hypothetical protein